MSIDLNWETVTTGPDGEALALSMRDFIHTKFQSVPLPRFIKSVTVHAFEFGTTPPEFELKDITDPLPDFYEENPDADDSDEEELQRGDGLAGTVHESHFDAENIVGIRELHAASDRRRYNGPPGLGHMGARLSALPPHITTGLQGGHMRGMSSMPQDLGSPFLGTSTPGIPGGTSNLNYFQSHLTSGLSGTQTPLAAVAGAQIGKNNNNNNNINDNINNHSSNHNNNQNHHHLYCKQWKPESYSSSSLPISTPSLPGSVPRHSMTPDGRVSSHSRNPSQGSISVMESIYASATSPPVSGTLLHAASNRPLREKSSVSTFAPTVSTGTSRPPTRDNTANTGAAPIFAGATIAEDDDNETGVAGSAETNKHARKDDKAPRFREPRIEDIQAVFRIRYSGDVRLLLTADILLDYPMPSFVGIPLRLSITGLSFDGVGVLAYIRKRVHFCFLSPEDALAAVGPDEERDEQSADDSGTGSPSYARPGNGKMNGLLQEIRVESEIGQREGGKQSLKNVGKVERFVLDQVRRIFEEEFVYPSFWTFLV